MYAESTISSEDRWPFMYDESEDSDEELCDADFADELEYDIIENDADLPDTPSGVNSFNAIGQFVEDVKLWTDCLEYVLEERIKREAPILDKAALLAQELAKEKAHILFCKKNRLYAELDKQEAHQLSLKEDKLYANFFKEDVELTSAEILQEYKKTCQLAKQQVKPPQWKFGNK